MIPRTIIGPQEQFERSGAQSLRDIRPFTVRLREVLQSSASCLVFGMAAVVTWVEPALVDLSVPACVVFAIWVLTRRVTAPMRLPQTARLPDYGNPTPGSRKPRMSAGSHCIGSDLQGRELWITPEDARQHITVPGTTGAGKTAAILSYLVNVLAQGSGFVFVDGKADKKLFAQVLALARRFGREDDVRLLNFMVASGTKASNTFNAFAIGNPDAIREVIASQMGDQSTSGDTNGIFKDRAVSLIASIAPALCWLRDCKGVPLTVDVIRSSIELPWIWKLAMRKVFTMRDPETGIEEVIDVSADIPEDVIWPLKSYLGELPEYDATVPLDKQKSNEHARQHGFAQMYFTPTFTQLTVSLGHIFKVENGDIDMRDIVLNRRILVVNLPAMENSDATLAALGKMVVASLRGMMAQLLGASPEGDYSAADETAMGSAPFTVVFDELAYYATSGLDRMLAQGRGLNISFVLGFQEVSGIWDRLGEKTASLLGNSNLTLAMRQQDSGRTREWLEKTAGQTNVTQATSYQGVYDGAYREARQAEVRTVCRVDWADLTALIEGEAIVLFAGRRIYAKLFYAPIDFDGPKRLSRGLLLRAPDRTALLARRKHIHAIATRVERGEPTQADPVEPSPGLSAFLSGFAEAARAGSDARACVRGGFARIAVLPRNQLPARPPPPADGSPATAETNMLASASQTPFIGADTPGIPNEPVDMSLLRGIVAIERIAGTPEHLVGGAARAIMAHRDDGLDAIAIVEPPEMSPGVLLGHLHSILDRLAPLRGIAEAPGSDDALRQAA